MQLRGQNTISDQKKKKLKTTKEKKKRKTETKEKTAAKDHKQNRQEIRSSEVFNPSCIFQTL